MRWTPRHWLRRLLAAVIAVWFVLVMVEPAALHTCPVHGDHAAARPTASVVPDAATHHAAAATHAGHGTGARVPHDDHAGCTCPGDCTASGMGAAVPGAPVVVVAALASRTATGAPALVSHATPRAPYVLPFANGPPHLSRPA